MELQIWLCEDQPSFNAVAKLLREGWVPDPRMHEGRPFSLEKGLVYHLVKYTEEEMKLNLEQLVEEQADADIVVNVMEVKLDDKPETIGQWIDKGWRICKERFSGKVQIELVKKLSELHPELFKKAEENPNPDFRTCELCGVEKHKDEMVELPDGTWLCGKCDSESREGNKAETITVSKINGETFNVLSNCPAVAAGEVCYLDQKKYAECLDKGCTKCPTYQLWLKGGKQ